MSCIGPGVFQDEDPGPWAPGQCFPFLVIFPVWLQEHSGADLGVSGLFGGC